MIKICSNRRNFSNGANYARGLVIEHIIICRLKKYRIMSDVFRNRLIKYDKVSAVEYGRINYRTMNQHR